MKLILPLVVLILLLGGYLVFSAVQPQKSNSENREVKASNKPVASASSNSPSLKKLTKLQDETKKAFSGNRDEEIAEKIDLALQAETNGKMYGFLVEAFSLMKESYLAYGKDPEMDPEKRENMNDSLEDLKEYVQKYFTEYKDADFIVPD